MTRRRYSELGSVTLIEMAVVLSLLAVVFFIAFPSFNTGIDKAYDNHLPAATNVEVLDIP